MESCGVLNGRFLRDIFGLILPYVEGLGKALLQAGILQYPTHLTSSVLSILSLPIRGDPYNKRGKQWADSKPGILSCPEIFPQFAKPPTGSKLPV